MMVFTDEVWETPMVCERCGEIHDEAECPYPQWLIDGLEDMPPEMSQEEVDRFQPHHSDPTQTPSCCCTWMV